LIGDYLRSTLEWQNWGANFSTFVFIVTVILSCSQQWGVLKQRKTVLDKHSTKSISIPFISYSACFGISFLYYGLATKSLAIIFNGSIGLFSVALLLTLNKVKPFTIRQVLLVLLFFTMIVAMILLKEKDDLLFLIMLGYTVVLSHQPFEMWKKKSVGSVDLRFIIPLLISATFWTINAFIIGNWVLQVCCPVNLSTILLVLGLWFRYRKPNPTS
jgi:uncharacterized protein with PQ loop repeat